MKRNLLEMSRRVYDVCVVGGGVYGACIAWDASLRGLSVALIEKGDFGHATSSKTLRVIHGGFRYLQHLDLLRVRRAIRERAVWMRIAPHLVHPLPVVVPTYRSLTRGRNAFRLALKVNDLIGWDRNRLGNRDRIIPAGRLISKSELLRLAPRIDCRGVTGGALWFDCQMRNSERLILSILQSAVQAGADVANYVEATASLDDGEGLRRVEARDVLGDGRFAIRARLVVEACGPWLGKLWEGENGARRPLRGRWLKAMNLVTKPLVDQCALGLWLGPRADGAGESRFVFIAPWHGHSLVGTTQAPYDGDPDCLAVGEQEIDEFMGQVNSLFDGGGLAREDIRFVHAGIVPADTRRRKRPPGLARRYRVYDHGRAAGKVISVSGVKFTEARYVSHQVVDLLFRKLRHQPPAALTFKRPVYGGAIEDFDAFLREQRARKPENLSVDTIEHLVQNYGTQCSRILDYVTRDPLMGAPVTRDSTVLKAQIVHAVREEMAQRLSDVVFRRTDLGRAGDPGPDCVRQCAAIMAGEMGWGQARLERELSEVKSAFLAGQPHG